MGGDIAREKCGTRVEPLISFEFSQIDDPSTPSDDGLKNVKPNPFVEYETAVQAFKNRYPFVHVYSAWNEPNHPRQPTEKDPETAGQYWRVLRSICAATGGNCGVIAGDVLDQSFAKVSPAPSTAKGLAFPEYLRRYKAAMGRRASSWAIHPYQTAQKAAVKRPKNEPPTNRRWNEFLKATACPSCSSNPNPGVWITEAGGVRSFTNSSGAVKTFPVLEPAEQVKHGLELATNSRVRSFLYYSWAGSDGLDATGRRAGFDSGLVLPVGPTAGPDAEVKKLGTRRDAYCPVFRSFRPTGTTGLCT